jgi:hypothetical protein
MVDPRKPEVLERICPQQRHHLVQRRFGRHQAVAHLVQHLLQLGDGQKR